MDILLEARIQPIAVGMIWERKMALLWKKDGPKAGVPGHPELKPSFPAVFQNITGTSLVVQGLRLHAPNEGGPDSICGQGTRSHMPQLRVLMPRLRIPCAATKIWHK